MRASAASRRARATERAVIDYGGANYSGCVASHFDSPRSSQSTRSSAVPFSLSPYRAPVSPSHRRAPAPRRTSAGHRRAGQTRMRVPMRTRSPESPSCASQGSAKSRSARRGWAEPARRPVADRARARARVLIRPEDRRPCSTAKRERLRSASSSLRSAGKRRGRTPKRCDCGREASPPRDATRGRLPSIEIPAHTRLRGRQERRAEQVRRRAAARSEGIAATIYLERSGDDGATWELRSYFSVTDSNAQGTAQHAPSIVTFVDDPPGGE